MTNDLCWLVWETGNADTYRCFNVQDAAAAASEYLGKYAAEGTCEVSVSKLAGFPGVKRFKLVKSVTPLE